MLTLCLPREWLSVPAISKRDVSANRLHIGIWQGVRVLTRDIEVTVTRAVAIFATAIKPGRIARYHLKVLWERLHRNGRPHVVVDNSINQRKKFKRTIGIDVEYRGRPISIRSEIIIPILTIFLDRAPKIQRG